MSTSQIIAAFDASTSRTSFLAAERAARRLTATDQLTVIDALVAAEHRLGLRFPRRDFVTGCLM
jgi:hypothetical protein